MRKGAVLIDGKEASIAKDIIIFDEPSPLRPILHPIGWKILHLLSKEALYPMKMAKQLRMHEQKVYYHVKRLKAAGLLTIEKEEIVKGALAKYYRATYPAFGVELPFGERRAKPSGLVPIDEKLASFFGEFISSGTFDGRVVVGLPEPHGPHKALARDGHYGIQLAFFLGQFVALPRDFVVKLDVDVKAEKEESNNLILIGGPGTNLLTADVNKHLPTRFDEQNYWAGLVGLRGRTFNSDRDGLIAKIPNPYDDRKTIIVLAGLRYIGTKSTIIAITNFYREVLANYGKERRWATVIRGFDLDGDGKIDSVEVMA